MRGEFCKLFDYKVSLFLQELLSVLFAPLVLCISLPKCTDQIIDFFREFTIHVDGLGYVCSFSQFDFEKHGNPKYGVEGAAVEDDYYLSKEGKMEKSFLNFKANNPHWEPRDTLGSMYLGRLEAFNQEHHKGKRTLKLNEYGIPEDEDDDDDDSFEQQETWRDASDSEDDKPKQEGMIGLLNQFYDLNNNNRPL